MIGWKKGLKANALYRDGCKLSQPLSTNSKKEKKEKKESEEKKEIVERVVYKEVPRRRKLPDERRSITHKLSVAGHEAYVHVGLYEDGSAGELFIKMSKEGSTLSGVMDTLALSISMNLQYGVPIEVLCSKLVHTRFEPMGMTTNKEIPMVTSIMDYLGRWLALKFLPKEQAMQFHNKELVQKAYDEGTKSKDAFAMSLPILDEGATAQVEDRGAIVEEKTSAEIEEQVMEVEAAPTKMEIAKLQGFTGSICTGCGSVRVKRNGSCEVCLDCGATSGCS